MKKRDPLLLHYATEHNNIELVEKLLSKKADIHAVDGNNNSCLYFAISNRHIEIAELLIHNGADVTHINDARGTALLIAFKQLKKKEALESLHLHAKQIKLITLLIESGSDINYKGLDGRRPIHYAAGEGAIGLVSLLLKNNVKINVKCWKGKTPLMYAIEKNKPETAMMLIDNKAKIKL